MMLMERLYKASIVFGVALVFMQPCMASLPVPTSNSTDQLALLAFMNAINVQGNGTFLRSNWSEKSGFCDWYGVSCSPRHAQRVRALRLLNMGLQGTISLHIGNLSFLEVIDLSGNSFYGRLPQEIGHLHRLKLLILERNALEGRVPLNLFQCQRLEVLVLQRNNFTGGIPKELYTLRSLRTLFLGSNNFTGTIPASLGNASSIKWLGLEGNHIEGTVPPEFDQLINLEGLNLYDNHLSGSIPPGIFNISSISQLLLPLNNFSGSLPPTAGLLLPNLSWFQVQRNQLSGNIPSHLSNCSKLFRLLLGENLFTGQIPASLGQLPSLKTLQLFNNKLTGQIPKEIWSRKVNFTYLDFSDNFLNGTIPPTIGELTSLQRLYLDNNNVEGSVPNEICEMTSLGELSLQGNKLSGSIPSCIGKLSNLRLLFLGSNKLGSSIPSSIWNLENLLFLNLSSNSLGGNLSTNIRSMKALGSMDLSGNQISGNIPLAIGALSSLTSLSLSGNLFSGLIPESLGNLRALNYLDLSQNNLSGAIPKTLEALSSLLYFNLSLNMLTGEIPTGGPFANLAANAIKGNVGLCGKPILQVSLCRNELKSENSKRRTFLLKYILPPLTALVTLAAFLYVLKNYRRKNVPGPHSLDSIPTIEHKPITYQELRYATNDFCDANFIGAGSYGSVYKGKLLDGTDVAVKVLNLQHEGAFKSFDVECRVLRAALHRNLVKVISTCSNPDLRALVLQYLSNGSVERWLYSHNYCLNLLQRVNVILDVAMGLEYLHHSQTEVVVHCDLKPSNILLDEDMVAHVSDFGIAKILAENNASTQTRTLGSIGYIAPEYGHEGWVTARGDMYSYGIMLLEIFTRKKPTDEVFTEEQSLRQWVSVSLPDRVMEIVDNGLAGTEEGRDMTATEANLLAIMELGLDCSEESPNQRCNIKEVVVKLNKIKLQILCNRVA